jgi:outer membrane protein assembly factor BamA
MLVFGLCLLALLLPGCTATKFLKEGETFYDGAVLNFETPQGRVRKAKLEENLYELIEPKPNGKFLGNRPGAWFYYIAGTPKKKKGGLRNFIRNKLGSTPVLLKDATPERTARLLQGETRNEGYFFSTVSQKVETRGKASKVIYSIVLYRPYRLRNIVYPKDRDSTYARIFKKLHEESLLDSNQRYDLNRLKTEQERVEREVENEGFYYFDDRYLLFEADSTVGKRKVDIQLRMKDDVPQRARRIYRIDKVNVYPDYALSLDTVPQTGDAEIIKVEGGYNYIDRRHNFRPHVITRVINLRHGEIYSREAQELTLSHLMGLGAFKFVNVKFEESPRQDSSLLNANVYLTPLRKKSLRAEVQAVSKSNNFVGPGATLTFTNRNFLKGAELFQFKLHAAYEWQISNQTSGALNSIETGFEASLTVPRFITPIRIDYSSLRYLPKTQFKAGFNLQNRVGYFRLSSFNVGYGYNWQETAAKSHQLFPIDITFVRTDKTSALFEKLLNDAPVLANSFENQFIVGTRYSFTLNTQIKDNMVQKYKQVEEVRHHNFYLNFDADIAGNLLHTIQKQFNRDAEEPYKIFDSPYSQFLRGAIDIRHYWDLDDHNRLVTRATTGIGYAFGNASTMPYIKQFSIGGSNSIRAFPARSIGPGTYDIRAALDTAENKTRFIDQRADIKIEGNMEYRFDIIKALKGAVFVDAGNIWLMRADSTRPGGEFHRSNFLKQIAVGTGMGLRMDFSFFVLRLDVAFPLRKPYLPENERWVIRDIDFGSSRWRSDNLVFNIAIGYPF